MNDGPLCVSNNYKISLLLFCFIFFFSSENSYGSYKDNIAKTLLTIKAELMHSRTQVQVHEATIIKSKEFIQRLQKKEVNLEQGLNTLQDRQLHLKITLQKIATQPIFASLIARQGSLLSTARSINLIKFLTKELETNVNNESMKLKVLTNLKDDINLEWDLLEKTKAKLDNVNQKIAKLTNKRSLLGKNDNYINLSKDLRNLLSDLREVNIQKEKSIESLTNLSGKNTYNKKGQITENNLIPSRSFRKNKPHIRYPVRGKIVAQFGKLDSVGLTTKGITIRTRPSANVTASFDGKILYAGLYRTYGKIIIIDHGEGFKTLLIGLGRINVKTGQSVLSGENVGKMDPFTPNDLKINYKLYIELRKHGKPIDPMAWLSPIRNAT
jgi:murein hydrolase activator